MKQTIFFVSIDGADVSTNFLPVLNSIQIKLTDGGKSDTCDISLDDTAGRLKLPREDADITVMLSWSDGSGAVFFEGKTDAPKSTGARGQGMVLNITAHATDMKGDPKKKQEAHKDDAKFGDVAKDWGKKSGLEVKVSDKLADKQRPYWAMQNENFLQWGSRVAQELGATFKVMGKRAVFVPRNSGQSTGGASLASVAVIYGVNLIEWDITPFSNRPRYDRSVVRWYDRKEAKWKREVVQIQDETARVPFVETRRAPTQERAKDHAESNAEESKRAKGGGTVTIDGDPNAQPQAIAMIQGVRPGVDGMYRITEATHDYSRDNGWTTMLDLENPQDGTGKDDRKESAK